jgi:hypothetical protein
MFGIKIKIIIGLIMLTVLAGCAGKKNPGDDAARTKAEGTALGTAGGTVARSLLGNVIRKKKRLSLNSIWSLFGSTGGYMLGNTVAERKFKYVSDEDRLNGEIKAFNEQNEELIIYNKASTKEIAYLERMLLAIAEKKETKQKQVALTTREKNTFIKRIETDRVNRARLETELSELTDYLKSLQDNGDQSKVAQLRQEMNGLEKNIAQLNSNNRQMDQLVATLPVRN